MIIRRQDKRPLVFIQTLVTRILISQNVTIWREKFGKTKLKTTSTVFKDLRRKHFSTKCNNVCFLPNRYFVESPRWLFIKGRNKQAIAILQKAAKYNQVSADFTAETIVVKKEETISITTGIKTMMKSKPMLFRSLILILNWYVSYLCV